MAMFFNVCMLSQQGMPTNEGGKGVNDEGRPQNDEQISLGKVHLEELEEALGQILSKHDNVGLDQTIAILARGENGMHE